MAPPPVRRTIRRGEKDIQYQEQNAIIVGEDGGGGGGREGGSIDNGNMHVRQIGKRFAKTQARKRYHGRYTRKGRDSGPVTVIDRRPASRTGCAASLRMRNLGSLCLNNFLASLQVEKFDKFDVSYVFVFEVPSSGERGDL